MPVEELGIEFFAEGFKGLERALSSIENLTDKTAFAMDDMASEASDMSRILARMEDVLIDISGDMRTVAESTEDAEDEVDNLGDQFKKTGKEARGFSSFVSDTLSVALGNILAKAASVAAESLARVGEAAVDAFADSFTMAVDFESSLSRLEIAASATGLTFDELSAAAIAVGGDSRLLGVSASGAAEAMEGLFKAGLTNTEVFGDLNAFLNEGAELSGALRAAIDLAASSELDMVAASDLAAVALATFGGELETEEQRAEFITAAMDNLVKSADASVTSVSGLGEALSFVGPTASQAGLSFEETTNAIALLSGAGIEGSRAGTSLEAMLRSLIAPTDQAQGEFKKLGIELFDQEGNFKALNEIVGDFEGALGDMTDEQRSAAMGTIFTAQGMRSMNVLLAEGVEGWDDMATATEAAAGIQEQAAAKSATFAGKLEAFEGVVETLQITLGTKFLPVATEFLTWVTGMAETQGPAIIGMFDGLSNALGFVFSDLQELLGGSLGWRDFVHSDFEPTVQMLLDAFEQLGVFWAENGPEIMKIAQDTFASIAGSIGELAQEVVPFLIEQFAKFANYLVKNGPKIVKVISGVGKAIALAADVIVNMWKIAQPIFGALVDVMLGLNEVVLNVLTGNWAAAWDAAVKVVQAAWQGVQDSFLALANWVTSWFGTTWADVVAQWGENWDLFLEIVDLAWAGITQFIDDALVGIGEFVDDFVKGIQKTWNGFWKGVEKTTSKLTTAIARGIDNWLNKVFEDMGLDLDTMVSRWTAIWNNVLLIVDTVWARIMETIDTWLTRTRTFIQQQLEEIQGFWNSTWNAISEFVETTWSGISESIGNFVSDIYDAVTTKIAELEEWLNTAWTNIRDDVTKKARAMKDNVVNAIKGIGTYISENLATFAGWGAKIIDNILSGIGNLIENNPFIAAISGALDGLKTWIETNVDIAASLGDVGRGIIDGILNGLKAAAGSLISYLTGIIEDVISDILGSLGLPGGGVGGGEQPFGGNAGSVDAIGRGGSFSTTNIFQETNQFNLTTQSSMRDGGLEMEFDTMALLRTR